MAWVYLLIAGLFEVAYALSMKMNHGFTRLWPTVATFCAAAGSFYFFANALKSIPVGTGYPVWTGIGTVGTAILGILFLGESLDALRLLSMTLILIGVIGLKLAAGGMG